MDFFHHFLLIPLVLAPVCKAILIISSFVYPKLGLLFYDLQAYDPLSVFFWTLDPWELFFPFIVYPQTALSPVFHFTFVRYNQRVHCNRSFFSGVLHKDFYPLCTFFFFDFHQLSYIQGKHMSLSWLPHKFLFEMASDWFFWYLVLLTPPISFYCSSIPVIWRSRNFAPNPLIDKTGSFYIGLVARFCHSGCIYLKFVVFRSFLR